MGLSEKTELFIILQQMPNKYADKQ